MTIQCTTLPPLFFLLFYPVITAIVAATDYPNQKYVLQKRLPDGTIRKVKTYDWPITRDQAEAEHGPGCYSLKLMKPRISLIWKDGRKSLEDKNEIVETQPLRLEPLERKTKYLAIGLVGLGVGTAAGLGATAVVLLDHAQRLNRTDAIMDAMQGVNLIPPFYCAYCSERLPSPVDKTLQPMRKEKFLARHSPDGRNIRETLCLLPIPS